MKLRGRSLNSMNHIYIYIYIYSAFGGKLKPGYIYIYINMLKKTRNLEIVFHFHNRFISFIQDRQMDHIYIYIYIYIN